MVDFKKLRKKHGSPKPIDPIELFRRMPRTTQVNDLWNSQAEALREWNTKRQQKDIVIKLNTGGGKTLVGLLAAQSIANETNGAVLYLCPTVQLRDQTFSLSKQYGFKTLVYERGVEGDADFLNGKSILIATYSALFNGRSRFGLSGLSGEFIPLEGIVFDDAHTAFSNIRNYFTLNIEKKQDEELYHELCTLFRKSFGEINRQGTFDDIVEGRDFHVLEVPYWTWKEKIAFVRQKISSSDSLERYRFVWPLLRDEFENCHCLISSREVSITPLFPLVDYFPSFTQCPRRIYMSATLADDSSIVRTFNADMNSVSSPIVPKSLAGVGQRMILVPRLMKIDSSLITNFVKKMLKKVSLVSGAVVLTPSNKEAQEWEDIAEIPSESEAVSNFVNSLQSGQSYGPFAFSNRYDGIDLFDNSCRLLVLSGKPKGKNAYDMLRHIALNNSRVTNISIAQRIEQGIGRGTRGAGDYCAVILLGKSLVSWITKSSNLKLLTPSTRAQLKMGNEFSKTVSSYPEFEETLMKCLEREQDWVEYHAAALAELSTSTKIDMKNLEIAKEERKFFRLFRQGDFDAAIAVFEKYNYNEMGVDKNLRGWLLQLCARAASFWGNEERAQAFQKHAFSLNRSLSKPPTDIPYDTLVNPGKQAESIVKQISEYSQRKGFLSRFEEIQSRLTVSATANQFEQSLKDLGTVLGFKTQRPENDFGKGPDVLWILGDTEAFVIEAKSKKKAKNPLNKEEYGQILTSYEWFKKNYPNHKGMKVVVHPNRLISPAILCSGTYALTLSDLLELSNSAKVLFKSLCESNAPTEKLRIACERKLADLNLTPEGIKQQFVNSFELKQ